MYGEGICRVGEVVDLGEHLEEAIGILTGNARTCVLDGNADIVVGHGYAHDDVLAIGILGGVVEQLTDATYKVAAIGMDMEIVGHIGTIVEGHARVMLQHLLEALAGQIVAEHFFIPVGIEFLGGASGGAVEEHEHHALEHEGIMAHHIGDALRLFLGQIVLALLQHLSEAHDDVEGRTYLMGHVLDEERLLTVGLLGQFAGTSQFLVTTSALVVHLLDLAHMTIERLLHSGKIIAQMAHDILIMGARDLLVVMTLGNTLQLEGELVERTDHLSHGHTTEDEDHEQTDDNEGREDISQEVVVLQDAAFRTDKGEAPVGAWHGLITDDTGLTLDHDTHTTLLARGHLMAQGDDVGILVGIDIAEDGLGEELGGVRMEIIATFLARHEEIGVGVRRLGGDDLGEAQEGEVGGDDAHETLIGHVKGFAIGGNHAVEREFERVALVVIHGPAGLV